MPRDKLLFKFVGPRDADGNPTEFHDGIPPRDLHESDRPLLSDEQMVTLAASRIYRARNDADDEVAEAEKRLERAEPAPDFGVPGMPAPSAAPTTRRRGE